MKVQDNMRRNSKKKKDDVINLSEDHGYNNFHIDYMFVTNVVNTDDSLTKLMFGLEFIFEKKFAELEFLHIKSSFFPVKFKDISFQVATNEYIIDHIGYITLKYNELGYSRNYIDNVLSCKKNIHVIMFDHNVILKEKTIVGHLSYTTIEDDIHDYAVINLVAMFPSSDISYKVGIGSIMFSIMDECLALKFPSSTQFIMFPCDVPNCILLKKFLRSIYYEPYVESVNNSVIFKKHVKECHSLIVTYGITLFGFVISHRKALMDIMIEGSCSHKKNVSKISKLLHSQ